MNKLEKSLVSVAALTGSFVGLGSTIDSGSVAEAAPIEQGIYDIPDECVKYNDGYGVSENAERALVAVGFTGIEVDGEISNSKEQGAVIGAQKFLKDIDVLDDDVPACGYAGSITLNAVRLMQNPSHTGESQISQSQPNTRPKILNSSVSCDSIELTSWADSRLPGSDGDRKLDNGDEARAVQEALNRKGFNVGIANGDVGSRTLGSFALFQEEKFGKVDCLLGSQTFAAMGIVSSSSNFSATNTDKKRSFNSKVDCPSRISCEILVDLSDQKVYIKKNDRKYSTANGENLFISNAQTGAPGSETDLGHATLGRVEYGPKGNPWRLSTITQAVNPQAEPNLYKFRRINPDSGKPSGEGFHGSPSYREGVGPRSAGCVRLPIATADIMSDMPTGTAITVTQ